MRVADKLSEIITVEGAVDIKFKSKPQVFLSKIKDIKFTYLKKPDLNKSEYIWLDEWIQNYLPTAIKLTISSENQEYASTIFLPTA